MKTAPHQSSAEEDAWLAGFFGPRCKTKDTDDLPEIDIKKGEGCPACRFWDAIDARDRTKAQELLARLKAEGPKDDPLEPSHIDPAYNDGFNRANNQWRTLLDNKAKELE